MKGNKCTQCGKTLGNNHLSMMHGELPHGKFCDWGCYRDKCQAKELCQKCQKTWAKCLCEEAQ